MTDPFYKDKVVVITGASSGIGKELALRLAEQGLVRSPGDPELTTLRVHLQQVLGAAEALADAVRLTVQAPLEALLAGVKACDDVEAQEPDPLNWYHRKARSERERVRTLLASFAQREALEAERHEQAGRRRDACRAWMAAARALPSNAEYIERANRLRDPILQESANFYFAGYQLLGRDDLQARTNFITVTNIGLPNLSRQPREMYYEKAVEKLSELARR